MSKLPVRNLLWFTGLWTQTVLTFPRTVNFIYGGETSLCKQLLQKLEKCYACPKLLVHMWARYLYFLCSVYNLPYARILAPRPVAASRKWMERVSYLYVAPPLTRTTLGFLIPEARLPCLATLPMIQALGLGRESPLRKGTCSSRAAAAAAFCAGDQNCSKREVPVFAATDDQ